MALKHPKGPQLPRKDMDADAFSAEGDRVPRHELPARETTPDVAYQIIHDELCWTATRASTWRPS